MVDARKTDQAVVGEGGGADWVGNLTENLGREGEVGLLERDDVLVDRAADLDVG